MKATNALARPAEKAQSFSAFITAPAMQERINALAASREDGAQFMTAITSAVTTNPDLQRCSHMSILNCALMGLSLKLTPSPQMGQYYMIPFDDKESGPQATFILGYKGYVQLAIRSGQYRKLNVLPVKAGELVRYDPLEEEIQIRLIENDDEREAAPTVGYFAIFETISGYRKTLYWSRAKMEAHAKRYSKGYQSDLDKGASNTFWSKDFDGMAIKTMLRQMISKWGPMSVDLQRGIEADTEGATAEQSFVQAQAELPPAEQQALAGPVATDTDASDSFFRQEG